MKSLPETRKHCFNWPTTTVAGGKGRASDKVAALEAAGVAVAHSLAFIGETMAEHAPALVG